MTKRKSAAAIAAAQPSTETPATPKTPRENSKMAALAARLASPEGATLAELQALSGWQAHSVRGVLAGALKKTFGLTIVSAKEERGRVYRAVKPEAQA